MKATEFQEKTEQIVQAVSQVIIGKDREIRLVLAAFFGRRTCSAGGCPGTGQDDAGQNDIPGARSAV